MTVAAVAPASAARAAPPTERPIESSALLPAPNARASIGTASTILALQDLLQSLRDMGVETGEKRTATANVRAKNEISKAANEELERQEEERNRTFWDDIADVFSEIGKWVGAVASTVAAVMTCGAATPLAALAVSGAVLSCMSVVDSTFGISEALLGKEASMWLNLGMSIGGAVCSGGASAVSLLSKAPEAATAAASTAKGTASIIAGATTLATGVSSGVGAITRGVAAGHRYEAEMAAANEQAAVYQQKRLERLIDSITETLGEIVTSKDRQLRNVGGMMSQWNQTQIALVRA